MNLLKFDELMKESDPGLCQWVSEWRTFLEFVDGYFWNREILNPVVVEIGIASNCQKPFYNQFLNAEHIGIDINPEAPGHPDILGNSRDPETIEKLAVILAGRAIDLLFIDGDHAYEFIRRDYEIYAPLTKHIIAIHDIYTDQWDESVPAANVKLFLKT